MPLLATKSIDNERSRFRESCLSKIFGSISAIKVLFVIFFRGMTFTLPFQLVHSEHQRCVTIWYQMHFQSVLLKKLPDYHSDFRSF